MAVGTPQRVLQLLENSALKLHPKLVIILDCSFLDARKRTLFEEVRSSAAARTVLLALTSPYATRSPTACLAATAFSRRGSPMF